MRIESKRVDINASQKEIFDFLSDFRNFEKLIPKDKVSKWTATNDTCSFNINGMADIGMKIVNKIDPSEINIVSHGKNPFEFTLNGYIENKAGSGSEVQLVFNAEVNPFLSMMVEKPLGNFFNMLAEKLKQIYN